MKYEKSCGAIIFRRPYDAYEFLIIQHRSGHWGFPKGHVEPTETERQTAIREVYEETGLSITILDEFRVEERYSPRVDTFKTVVYFLARAESDHVVYVFPELIAHVWLTFPEACKRVSFPSLRTILTQAHTHLTSHSAFPS